MKKVSVIVACRNEEKFINQCLVSLLDQDYPKELIEIIVVDGMSTDKTFDVANSFRESHQNVKLEVNLNRHKYSGLNQVIPNLKSDYVAIADAHSTYPNDYIRKCVSWMDVADNVGGKMVFTPRSKGFLSKAMTFALTVPFSIFK